MNNQSIVDNNKAKIYPWPTYYQTVTAPKEEVGEREQFPGENIFFSDWPEVKFVEDFIKALTEMKEDLQLLEEDIDNKPGFDNFAPLSVLDTPLLGNETAACRWFSVGRGGGQIQGLDNSNGWERNEAIFGILGENAFLFGDYSFINSLSLWKSQLGFNNGWGYKFLDGGQGNLNGYTPGGLTTKPQRILENPVALANLTSNNNLGRYSGAGIFFETLNNSVMNKECKISPTTKEGMRKAGYVDALNALSTMYGEGDKDSLQILKALKTTNSTPEKLKDLLVKNVKKALKKRWGNNYSEDDYPKWAIKATAALDVNNQPKAEIITQNKFYDAGQYSYVKTGKILTLKGPIPISLNDVIHSQTENGNFLSANPYKNPSNGVKLMTEKEINDIGRKIEFIEEGENALPKKLQEQFNSFWKAEKQDANASTKEANRESLIYSLLATNGGDPSRPIWNQNNQDNSVTAYKSYPVVDKSNRMLTSKNFLIPHRAQGQRSYALFFQSEERIKPNFFSESTCFYDLGTPRAVYNNKRGAEFNDFVGITSRSTLGANDAFVQTPIWTLNYPMYKCPLISAHENYAAREEVAGWDPNGGALSSTDEVQYGIWPKHNIYRNQTTWWGINQWGVKTDPQNNTQGFKAPGWNDKNWLKPLAYIFVMSLGIDLYNNTKVKLGHFPPFDGGSWDQLSSFSTFTHYGKFDIPRSYALLIGAVLWRAKEGYALQWDGIDPSNNDYKGWNRYNKTVGIDDLSDPVWFFHNCISKPWYLGGAVFTQDPNTNYYINQNYRRYYVGTTKNYNTVDLWTTSGGDAEHRLPKGTSSAQYLIGSKIPLSNINISTAASNNPGSSVGYFYWATKNSSSYSAGWLKTHQYSSGIGDTQTDTNIRRGMFDQCRQDQMPFVFVDNNSSESRASYLKNKYSNAPKWYHPKTLSLTNLGTETNRYAPTSVPSATLTTSLGFNTQAPNRVKNAYLNLKEECKELMFIPKSLKESFIEYFEEFALNAITVARSGKGTGPDEFETGYASWLQTMDPLNFSSTYGLGDVNNDYYKVLNTQVLENYNNGQAQIKGFYGFIPSKLKMNDGTTEIATYYSDSSKNPWGATYGVDDNKDRLGPKISSTSSSSSSSSSGAWTTSGGISKHGNCFKSNDLVEMFNGEMIAIKNVKVGDEVKSVINNKVVKGIVTKKLIHPIKNIVEVIKINGITAEPNHPVYINQEWVPIKELGTITTEFIDNWYNLEIDCKTDNGESNFIIGNLIVSGVVKDDSIKINKTQYIFN